jgi:hypothetical protein
MASPSDPGAGLADPRAGRPSVKSFGEENVDGFVDDKPVWVAYCDECGAKLTAEEHAKCPYQDDVVQDEQGNVVSFRCRRCR